MKKKLSPNIERIDSIDFRNYYQYTFSSPQFLEQVDNPEYFGISHEDFKQQCVDVLTNEFRLALEQVILNKNK